MTGSGGVADSRYLPRRVFACADFQRLEQRTGGLRFLSGRLLLRGSGWRIGFRPDGRVDGMGPEKHRCEIRTYNKCERE